MGLSRLGLKPHYEAAHAAPADGLWFEVHPENYMVDGGPRLAWLETIRCRHPIALHGVGLSLAADAAPDALHLARLCALVERFEPALVSEHLAWSTWRGAYRPDLLPFPRTGESLARLVENVERVQRSLRGSAIENPSHYLRIEGHDYGEIAFRPSSRARLQAAHRQQCRQRATGFRHARGSIFPGRIGEAIRRPLGGSVARRGASVARTCAGGAARRRLYERLVARSAAAVQ
jgi:hypothetical protein